MKDESLSLRRAVSILRLFRGTEQSLALKDVVALTGMSKTACHRLLSTWVAERFLVQSSETGRYQLGTEMLAFSRLGVDHSSVRDAAVGEVRALARSTGDVALLHVLDDDEALCIDRHDGDYPVRTAGVQIGGRLPLHCGGGPLAVLSFAPDEVIERVLAGPLPKLTERTLTTRVALLDCIRHVRARGFAIGDEDAFDYVVAVGAPVFGRNGLVGALSVGGIKPRYERDRIAETGRAAVVAACQISEKLGWVRPSQPVKAVDRRSAG